MPRRHLDEFLARNHVRVEAAKAYALLAMMMVCAGFVGYIAGRLDSREDHRAEIDRLQSTNAALVAEQAHRIQGLTAALSELTRRTTEAAVTTTEAARAANTAAQAVTTAVDASAPDEKEPAR